MSMILDSLRRPLGQHMTDHEEHVASTPIERLRTQHDRNEAARPTRDRRTSFDLPAQDNQKGLVRYLLSQLEKHNPEVYATAAPWCEKALPTISKTAISDVINRLRAHLAAPANVTAPAVEKRSYDLFTDVPDGYYAVTAEEGHLAFYRVSTWKDSGRRKVQIQAGPNWHAMRNGRDTVLEKIRQATPAVAGKLYADEIGRCFRCNLELTDDTSRAVGMGPTCRSK